MKKIISHAKRMVRKGGWLLLLLIAISPLIGVPVFIGAMLISLILFEDPVDEDEVLDSIINQHFTRHEVEVLKSGNKNCTVSDEEYLNLVGRYYSLITPIKYSDDLTWQNVELTPEALILKYDVTVPRMNLTDIDWEDVRKKLVNSMQSNNSIAQCLRRTGRSLIIRYYVDNVLQYEYLTNYDTDNLK